jgi:hypothetical protein
MGFVVNKAALGENSSPVNHSTDFSTLIIQYPGLAQKAN